MRTVCKGVEMEASAEISFVFKIGKTKIVQTAPLCMEEFARDPEDYGSILRSAYNNARELSAAYAKQEGLA